jgi:hypothetical protein
VSKNLKILIPVLLALMVAAPAAMAATFTVHGDLDNRFLVYTDQINFFSSNSASATELHDSDAPDTFGSIKYRIWMEAATNDGNVKGVYGIELGALRFGAAAPDSAGPSQKGTFSGDGVNIETRWAYTDFQLPNVDSKARFRIGLFTHKVNKHFWAETAMGVKFYGSNYYLAWMRGDDSQTAADKDWRDLDFETLSARYDLKMEPVKVGFFAAYFIQDNDTTAPFVDFSSFNPFTSYAIDDINTDADISIFAIGIDGSWSTATNFGKAFVNWDLIYEGGSIDDVSVDGVTATDLDLSAYFAHLDLGLTFGKATVTYTLYYASGDDNNSDNDLDGFMVVDTDASFSVVLNEGGYVNDDYFTDRYTISDKGIFVNKLALDYKATKKTKVGVALLYLATAEDMEWDNATDFGDPTAASTFTDDSIGFEVDAYVSHKLYPNLTLALNIGFLSAGDALDAFEPAGSRDGSGDVDVFRSTARVRYGF